MQEPLAIEFMFRTRYSPAKIVEGRKIVTVLERTMILCNEDILIALDQRQVEANGKQTRIDRAVPYLNPDLQSSAVTAAIEWACGAKPESMQEQMELPAPQRRRWIEV